MMDEIKKLSKANILFIITPISGGKNKLKLPSLIDSCLDKNKFNANCWVMVLPPCFLQLSQAVLFRH